MRTALAIKDKIFKKLGLSILGDPGADSWGEMKITGNKESGEIGADESLQER